MQKQNETKNEEKKNAKLDEKKENRCSLISRAGIRLTIHRAFYIVFLFVFSSCDHRKYVRRCGILLSLLIGVSRPCLFVCRCLSVLSVCLFLWLLCFHMFVRAFILLSLVWCQYLFVYIFIFVCYCSLSVVCRLFWRRAVLLVSNNAASDE